MTTGIRLADGVHEHTPAEITAFSITFVNGLSSGEAIATLDASGVVDDDQPSLGGPILAIDSTQIASPLINFVVSAGVAGATYMVTAKITTNLGQTLEGAVLVKGEDAVDTT